MARMTPIQISEYRTGFASGQAVGSGSVPVFPNASRTAWATAETGFHSANVWRPAGRLCATTNVLATKVSGKMNMNDAFWTTSTAFTFSPTQAMIQLNAYAKRSSNRN